MTDGEIEISLKSRAFKREHEQAIARVDNMVDYVQQFGLERAPFDTSVDSFFGAHGRQSLLAQLLHLLHFSDNLSLLTGLEGTGKTALLRSLQGQLSEQDYVFLGSGPALGTSSELFFRLAKTIGLSVSKDDSLQLLKARLKEWDEFSGGSLQVYILIDDAEALAAEAMSTLLELSRPGESGSCWHILLVGLPNLADIISSLQSDQDERAQTFTMPDISQEFVADYLAFRLAEAGYDDDPLFSESDEESIWLTSSGDLNRVNTNAEIHLLERAATPRHVAVSVPWLHLSALLALGLILTVAWWGFEEGSEPQQSTILLPTPYGENAEEHAGIASASSPAADLDVAQQQPKTEFVKSNDATISLPTLDKEPQVDPLMISGGFSRDEEGPQTSKSAVSMPAPASGANVNAKIKVVQPVVNAYSQDEQALLALQPDHYTLQVLAAESKPGIESFIEANSGAALRWYQTTRGGKPWYVVVLGDYSSVEQAKRATQKLPKNLQKAGPWPRTIESVQQQITEK